MKQIFTINHYQASSPCKSFKIPLNSLTFRHTKKKILNVDKKNKKKRDKGRKFFFLGINSLYKMETGFGSKYFLTMKVKTFSSHFNYAKVMAALVRNLTIPLMDIRMRINFYYEDLRTYLRNEKICYRSIAIK